MNIGRYVDCPFDDEDFSDDMGRSLIMKLKKGIFGITIENVKEHIEDVRPFLIVTDEEWEIIKKFVCERGTNWWYCVPNEYVEMECAKLSDLLDGRLSPIRVYEFLELPTKWKPEWNKLWDELEDVE